MLQSGSYLTVRGPTPKSARRWCGVLPSVSWGLQIQGLHFQRLRSWGSLCTHPPRLVLESCLSYLQTLVGWPLRTVLALKPLSVQIIHSLQVGSWSLYSGENRWPPSLPSSQSQHHRPTVFLMGDTEDPVSLEWHVCLRCVFRIQSWGNIGQTKAEGHSPKQLDTLETLIFPRQKLRSWSRLKEPKEIWTTVQGIRRNWPRSGEKLPSSQR